MLGCPDSMRWLMISRSTFLSICGSEAAAAAAAAWEAFWQQPRTTRAPARRTTHRAAASALHPPHLLSPLYELHGHQLPRVFGAAKLGHPEVAAANVPNLRHREAGRIVGRRSLPGAPAGRQGVRTGPPSARHRRSRSMRCCSGAVTCQLIFRAEIHRRQAPASQLRFQAAEGTNPARWPSGAGAGSADRRGTVSMKQNGTARAQPGR